MQLVILGATGDLATGKVFPALYALFQSATHSLFTSIIGFSRRQWSATEFRAFITEKTGITDTAFLDTLTFHEGTFDDVHSFHALAEKCTMPTAFFAAISHTEYTRVLALLAETLHPERSHIDIVLEKPIGTDEQSARAVWKAATDVVPASQVWLVDHYLAKRAVRGLPAASPEGVTKITLALLESSTAEGRATFYDATGALRDVGQNHLLNVLAEYCTSGTATTRVLFLESLSYIRTTYRGQYEGYRQHVDSPESTTETYFNIELKSSLPEWQQCVFVLTAGKGFAQSIVTITTLPSAEILELQPNISFDMSHVRGFDGYAEVFNMLGQGNRTPFVSIAEVLVAWKIIDAVRADWRTGAVPLVTYPLGTYNRTL